MKKKKILIAISIVFICGCGGLGLLVLWADRYESDTDIGYIGNDVFQDLSPVCKGEGVPEARAFDPNADIHPTIVMTEDGKYWKSRYGLMGWAEDGWVATSVSETEIVICIGEERGINLYCGQWVFQGQLSRPVTIRIARTGEAVRSDDLFKVNSCGSQWTESDKEYELYAISHWYLHEIAHVENH